MRTVKNIAYISVAILGTGAVLYLFLRYFFALLLPFLIAWGIALLVRRPARFIHRHVGIPERFLRLTLALALVALVLALLGVGIWRLSEELWRFFSESGGQNGLGAVLSQIASADGLFGGIFNSLGDTVGSALYSLLVSVLESLGRFISGFVTLIPRAFLFIIVTVIATVYFALDLDLIDSSVRRILPSPAFAMLSRVKRGVTSVLGKYLRAAFILMLITFLVTLLGMLLLGMPYAFLLALLLSVVDVLPILGVGAVLIPWCIYEFVFGSVPLGVGLIVLYVIHTFIRQFAESKILGKNLGIHPIPTLLFLYVGYSLFGFVGLLIAPAFSVLLGISLDKKNTAEVTESSDTK